LNSAKESGPDGNLSETSLGRNLINLIGWVRVDPAAWRSRLYPMISSIRRLLLVAAVAALCGTGILFILNAEAKLAESRNYSVLMAILFIVVLLVYRASQSLVMRRASKAIEQTLDEWRVSIAGKLMTMSLREVEAMTRGRLIDGLARHYEVLSQTVMPLIWGVESIILGAFMLVYVFSLSMIAGFLTVAVTALLIIGYVSMSARLQEAMDAAGKADAGLSRLAEEIVDGYKELRLNEVKNDAVRDDFITHSGEVAKYRSEADLIISDLFVSGNSASYMLVAGVVFVLPILSGGEQTEISRIVTAVIFLLGPIGGMVNAAQQLATARFTLQGIRAFEQEIESRAILEPCSDSGLGESFKGFKEIRAAGLHYLHPSLPGDEPGFGISGFDLTLQPGRILFITGTNGSGKTTALRVLCGLYPPQEGHIEIDGRALPTNAPQAYRELFAAVFSDFHTFTRPYALDNGGMERFEAALDDLGIRQKLPADLSQGYDPNILSTGQRKRLALACALAEDRPVLVLDEWAADQDPATRAAFYETMLPRIRAEGKAVVAVSHDERYFECADARYHMEDGRMTRVTG